MARFLSRALAGVTLLGALVPTAAIFAKDKIVIGEQNWTGAIAIQYILGNVITSRLDGDVSYGR